MTGSGPVFGSTCLNHSVSVSNGVPILKVEPPLGHSLGAVAFEESAARSYI